MTYIVILFSFGELSLEQESITGRRTFFFSFACKQVTGNFIAPKIHTWKHLEIFNVDYVVV